MSLRGVETVLHARKDNGCLINAVCLKGSHDEGFVADIVRNFRRIYEEFNITERQKETNLFVDTKEKRDENPTKHKEAGSLLSVIDRESESKDVDKRFLHQVC